MARVYIETYGCALNHGDTSIMKTAMLKRGHTIVDSIEDADVVIINTCTVRMETEQRMIHRIKTLYRYCMDSGKKLVVAGCMAKAQPYLVASIAPSASLVSPQNASRIYVAVESRERVVLLLGDRDRNVLGSHLEKHIAYIPIQDGCLGNCSFCIVKNARRKLVSYPIELIIDTVEKVVRKGAVEIAITGQDTAVYGLDLYGRQMLPRLVRAIVEQVKGVYRIRIGMMNPDTMSSILDELVDVLNSFDKVYRFLHIPVQSGSNHVLKIMRRRYTVDEYRAIVKELKRRVRDIAIATDIIVGHPGESEEDFLETIKLVKELEFDRIHIARYTVRPNTYSASLPQIPSRVVKDRLKRIIEVMEDTCLKKNRRYLDKILDAFITEYNNGSYTGRLDNYTPVIIPSDKALEIGCYKRVLIREATFYDLRGIVVD